MTNKMDGVCERIKIVILGKTNLKYLKQQSIHSALLGRFREKTKPVLLFGIKNVD